MTNGIKPSQHQIEGIRREKMALRRAEVRKQKFPILHMGLKDFIPIIIIMIASFAVGILIP